MKPWREGVPEKGFAKKSDETSLVEDYIEQRTVNF
jgi:hypothetical protein